MIANREAVMTALVARLNAVTFTALSTGETTWAQPVSRRLKLWSDTTLLQPALFVAVHAENDVYTSELTPSRTTITANLFVYIKTNDANSTPAIDLNRVLDGIDAAIAPTASAGKLTLGGLISHCRRDGQVMLDPGDLDGQGLAIIPIKILGP
jgi:hypothetical protein